MCDSMFRFAEPIFSWTFYPTLAYDAILGMRDFKRFMHWIKSSRKEVVSVRLSAFLITFCAAAGGLHGIFSPAPSDVGGLTALGFLLIMYSYPIVDYVIMRYRSRLHNTLTLPFALAVFIAGCHCVFAVYWSGEYRSTFN